MLYRLGAGERTGVQNAKSSASCVTLPPKRNLVMVLLWVTYRPCLHFHHVNLQTESPTSSPPLIKLALKGFARSHVAAWTPKIVRRPISWDALLGGQGLTSSLGPGGRVLRMSLALGYFFMARSDEIFASSTGVVHPVRCLTREDVA